MDRLKMSVVTKLHKELRPELAVAYVVGGLILAGFVDFITGVEIRVYPLYFFPLSLASWQFGRGGAILATVFAKTIWALTNHKAGLQYSADNVWIFNTLTQAVAFGTVAALMLLAKILLEREKVFSRTDSLTGLNNARAFYSAVAVATASCRRSKRPLTIAYIDLDNFKCINDRYGHSQGDAMLRDVASILTESLRATDIAARVGGDEFVVCFPETSKSQVAPILERLRAAIAAVHHAEECAISASIGAISWDIPLDNIDTMISAADETMYGVKKSGKNKVEAVSMETR
jgi:diguanylate cyclase (GGDEF)-like protein